MTWRDVASPMLSWDARVGKWHQLACMFVGQEAMARAKCGEPLHNPNVRHGTLKASAASSCSRCVDTLAAERKPAPVKVPMPEPPKENSNAEVWVGDGHSTIWHKESAFQERDAHQNRVLTACGQWVWADATVKVEKAFPEKLTLCGECLHLAGVRPMRVHVAPTVDPLNEDLL